MPIQLFPLTSGMQQQFDRRLLPDGVLANAVNCEMARVGRVQSRARYQALGTGVASTGAGALIAYDLVSFLDRLFVIGDDTRFHCPGNLYEYLGAGVAQPWRPTSPVADAEPRLGLATRVRDIARAPDQSQGAGTMSAAAFGGFAAMSWGLSATSTRSFLMVVRASSDQPVFCAQLSTATNLPAQHVRLIALSDRFLIVGFGTSGLRISVSKFAPATDTAVASVVTDVFAAAATVTFGICKVGGTDQIVIVARFAGNLVKIRRLNNAGTVQVPSGGQYADITGVSGGVGLMLAVEADSSANQLTVAVLDGGAVGLYSYNLSTGAAIGTGPFAPFSGDTCTNIELARVSATQLAAVASVSSGSQPEIKTNVYTVSSNALAGKITAVSDAVLTTRVEFFAATGALLFGIAVGDATLGNSPNILCSWLLTNTGTRLEIVKDFEVAGVPDDGGIDTLQGLAFDASTQRYYWSTAAADADASLAPLLTEFAYGLAERRQTAEYGGHLYISGGAPMVFDGVSAVESGFQLRPRIISLTPTTAVGAAALVPGGEYSYRYHQEWTDSKGDLHLSPPSTIEKVTMGTNATLENFTVASLSGPHSWRRSTGAHPGSAVTCVLSRNLVTSSTTAAVIIGLTSINPPSGVLNGLTLKFTVGGTSYTITFTVAAVDQATVLSEIAAVVNSAKVNATAPSGLLVLTSVAVGEGAILSVGNGTANTILGLTEGETEVGTTELTEGENFQRSASTTEDASTAVAAYVSLVDTRSDEHDPIQDNDLIKQQVLYSQGNSSGAHHAPPPSEFVAAGRERIIWSGHPQRSRFTATKIIVPGEPAECAPEGFPQYVGHISGDIEAGYVLGDAMVYWTRNQTWFVTGAGPNRAGQGEFSPPQCVNKRIGIAPDGWRGLLEDEDGVWFPGQDRQLYHCSRGGVVTWAGRGVRDYLESYPIVTAACARHERQELAFAITNTAGTTGGILRYRPDVQAWMFDDVGAVTSLSTYQGQLCYVQGGLVYLQDAAPGTGTFPTLQLDSGLFQGFQALGYGALQEIGALMTYRGPCTLTLKLGTDGETFPLTIASWPLTGAEYTVGQRVQLLVDSPQQEYDSFALRAEVSSVSGGTEGVWLHAFAIKSESQPDFVRLAPSRRQ